MRNLARVAALGVMAAILGGTGVALSQPAVPGNGPMGAPGMGGMGPGMMGRGPGLGRGFTDPASYLEGLKANLGITAQQQPAWTEYADTVQGVATQMQGAHEIMYDAMGTATWQERRDMMNRMFEARQQAFNMVHDAAQKLLPSLTAAQRQTAEMSLPGLRPHGRGMMRRMGAGTGAGAGTQ